MVILIGLLLAKAQKEWVYWCLVVVLFIYGLVRLVIVNHGYLLLTIIYPDSGREKLKMTIIVKNIAYYIGATIISVELHFVDIQVSFGFLAGVFLLLGLFSWLLIPPHEDQKMNQRHEGPESSVEEDPENIENPITPVVPESSETNLAKETVTSQMLDDPHDLPPPNLSEAKMLTFPVLMILCTMLMNRISNNVIVMLASLILAERFSLNANDLGFYYVFSVGLFFLLFGIYLVFDKIFEISNFGKIIITNYACVLACILCTPIFFPNDYYVLLCEILASLGILFFGVAGAQGFILIDMFEYHENHKGELDALTREYYISNDPTLWFSHSSLI